jgi:CheY-like chemotaxis protein
LLGEAGYTCVTSTTNPQEVCALHRKNRYDLILLDLQMPGMDGFRVMEGLKTNESDSYLPVIVLTEFGAAVPAAQTRHRCAVYSGFEIARRSVEIGNQP